MTRLPSIFRPHIRPKRTGGIIVTYPTNRMQDISELHFIWVDGGVLTLGREEGYSGRCWVRDRYGGKGRFRVIHSMIMDRVKREGLTGVKITTHRHLSPHLRESRTDTDVRYHVEHHKTERILA
jgi:hypothetical protein